MWHIRHFFTLLAAEIFRSDKIRDKAFVYQHGIERKDA